MKHPAPLIMSISQLEAWAIYGLRSMSKPWELWANYGNWTNMSRATWAMEHQSSKSKPWASENHEQIMRKSNWELGKVKRKQHFQRTFSQTMIASLTFKMSIVKTLSFQKVFEIPGKHFRMTFDMFAAPLLSPISQMLTWIPMHRSSISKSVQDYSDDCLVQ